jgi:DNA-binding NtrC family response regulator
MNAIIAAGAGKPTQRVERRLVQQLARMLGAWVLFYHADGRFLQSVDQDVHTLSSWSIRVLLRDNRIVARRVRRAPEFWRPEQRRPRAVLSFPIGHGKACLARGERFTRTEVQTVRTVLRFLESRRGTGVEETDRLSLVERDRPKVDPIPGLVGRSKPWADVLHRIWMVAPTDCSVVVLGASGTGKEHVARGVHLASKRAARAFVAVNCGAMSESTLRAELFGHVKGAYTGAHRAREGLLVQAHQGTLFLDEVADMPLSMQVALLRFLEDHKVLPLGGVRTRESNARVVCATNKDIDAEVQAGRFRADLLHRLDVVRIRVPALRERPGDLPLLAAHLLRRAGIPDHLAPEALDVLASHNWPGNVRELDNVLRAAALMSDDGLANAEWIERMLEQRRHPRARRPAPRLPSSLPPRAARVLVLMGRDWCSAADLAAWAGVSVRTIQRDLQRLAAHGMVEGAGAARSTRYRRTAR